MTYRGIDFDRDLTPLEIECDHRESEKRYHSVEGMWMLGCVSCGKWVGHLPDPFEEEEEEWESSETCPTQRAPGVRPDMKPHFSHSAGRRFESRRELREHMARTGLREVDPSEVGDAGEIEGRAIGRSEAKSRKIRNPKLSLEQHLHETFHGPVEIR